MVSDSDVNIGEAVNCLIIARGTITCRSDVRDCVIASATAVEFGNRGRQFNCTIKENDPAHEGVVVEPAEGGVRVKAADAAKPFAKAGLQPSDLIVSVDNQATDAPETFRKLLRRAWVGDEDVELRVRRQGKELCLRVVPR